MDISLTAKPIKEICDDCQGNGYRRIWEDTSETTKITLQCVKCNSQGELDVITPEEFRDKGVI